MTDKLCELFAEGSQAPDPGRPAQTPRRKLH
jgi:hypothetical protein